MYNKIREDFVKQKGLPQLPRREKAAQQTFHGKVSTRRELPLRRPFSAFPSTINIAEKAL